MFTPEQAGTQHNVNCYHFKICIRTCPGDDNPTRDDRCIFTAELEYIRADLARIDDRAGCEYLGIKVFLTAIFSKDAVGSGILIRSITHRKCDGVFSSEHDMIV